MVIFKLKKNFISISLCAKVKYGEIEYQLEYF